MDLAFQRASMPPAQINRFWTVPLLTASAAAAAAAPITSPIEIPTSPAMPPSLDPAYFPRTDDCDAWRAYLGQRIDANLVRAMKPHQVELVRDSLRLRMRLIIGADQGTGKTLVILVLLHLLRHVARRFLIVAPVSALPSFLKELGAWFARGSESVQWIESSMPIAIKQPRAARKRKRPEGNDADADAAGDAAPTPPPPPIRYHPLIDRGKKFVLVTNTIATLIARDLHATPFDVVVVDEARSLASMTSAFARVMLPLLQRATWAVALSGTIVDQPIQFFNVCNALRPDIGAFVDYRHFGRTFCKVSHRRTPTGAQIEEFKGCRSAEAGAALRALLLRHVMLRVLKAVVMRDVPQKQYARVYLEPACEADRVKLRELKTLAESNEVLAQQAMDGGTASGAASGAGAGKRARTSVGKAASSSSKQVAAEQDRIKELRDFSRKLHGAIPLKIRPLCAYLEAHVFDSGLYLREKVLLFAHHKPIMAAMAALLERRGVRFVLIQGGTPVTERGTIERAFQTDATVRVALLSISAACTGITLTAATRAYFAELLFNPSQVVQAEDRCHRIGTTGQVHITRVILRDSIDELIDRIEWNKRKLVAQIVDGTDTQT
jgi:hypothetical protein